MYGVQTIPAHSDPVTAVDIHRDGTLAISASYDGLIRMWNMDDGVDHLKILHAVVMPVSPLHADRKTWKPHYPLWFGQLWITHRLPTAAIAFVSIF
jgi:WD40 repeat protein